MRKEKHVRVKVDYLHGSSFDGCLGVQKYMCFSPDLAQCIRNYHATEFAGQLKISGFV